MTTIARPGGSYIDAELSADLAGAALDMARRFHHGATLWVISPQWEPHAHHIAVEFVHPVIMGKRALPSVALVEPDPVAQARVASQPGDLLIAVSFHPYARETAEVVTASRARGAQVLAISDSRLSPIAREAELYFEIKDAEVRQFRSLTASLCLAQTLVISYAYRIQQRSARES